jgi:hypothetical protein
MKWTHTLLLFFLCSYVGISAQELVTSSASPPLLNTVGDPITNIIDPDGMKQGIWFYTDINQVNLLRKHYSNNLCTQTDYAVNGIWVNAVNFEQDPLKIANIKQQINALLMAHQVNLQLTSNQQLAILLHANGSLHKIAFLGEWNSAQASQLETQIQDVFSNQLLNDVQNETFILY